MIGIICAVRLMARVPCCPICYSLIREPVVFPCHHEVCRECFDHSLKTANFCCPLCRKRVSSWARRHAKDPVDHRRKRELEERFQELQEDTTLYSATGKRADFLRALPYLQPKYVCTQARGFPGVYHRNVILQCTSVLYNVCADVCCPLTHYRDQGSQVYYCPWVYTTKQLEIYCLILHGTLLII